MREENRMLKEEQGFYFLVCFLVGKRRLDSVLDMMSFRNTDIIGSDIDMSKRPLNIQ